jgi:hypothetical protein
MPDLKVFLDDTLLISTPVNLQEIPPKRIKPRGVSFGPDEIKIIENRITDQDLEKVVDPKIDQRYYYFKDNKIKEGQFKGYDDELAEVSNKPYMMLKDDQTPNSIMDFVEAVYSKTSSGGKRKTRKSRKSRKTRKTRKTNKRRK